jgi:hypothetical protein
MEFEDLADINADLQERLSSWRSLPGVVEHSSDSIGESSINEAQVRQRQRRGASMCVTVAKEHDAFISVLRAFVENRGDRDSNQQQRIEDMSAFILGVYEQYSAENLHEGLKNELGNLPKEVIQTITVPAPQPPKSWLQRALGI